MELVALVIMIGAAVVGSWSCRYPNCGWLWAGLTLLWLAVAAHHTLRGAKDSDLILHVVLPSIVVGGVWMGWITAFLRRRRQRSSVPSSPQ